MRSSRSGSFVAAAAWNATAQGTAAICDVALDKYEEAWEKAIKTWCENQ